MASLNHGADVFYLDQRRIYREGALYLPYFDSDYNLILDVQNFNILCEEQYKFCFS